MTTLDSSAPLADVAVAVQDRMRYAASERTPSLVAAPPLQFLMIDGAGDPETTPAFGDAALALRALSAELRGIVDGYGDVAPLEALWWTEEHFGQRRSFADVPRDRCRWTAMIPQPERVHPEDVERARKLVLRRMMTPAVGMARLAVFAEGRVAQLLHVGAQREEPPSIARLHEAIAARGLRVHGKLHEIYVNDPIAGGTESPRIILRQPVA